MNYQKAFARNYYGSLTRLSHELTCENCKRNFTDLDKRRRFCTRTCYWAWRRVKS